MSNADYPALGFDPLPGHPEEVRALAAAARVFADRMTEQADVLDQVRRGANWTGEAAEAFAAGLEHLPGRLHAAGKSVHALAACLDEYIERFDRAKLGTWALEERARAALDTTEAAYRQPVMASPGAGPPDRAALDRASDDFEAILGEALRYQEDFEDSVADLAAAIHRLAEDAPDPPRPDLLDWATKVFAKTPVGRAIEAAHDLVNDFPHFFSELAEALQAISAAAAFLAVPCIVVPVLGEALGVIAIATAAGAAVVDTSLYAGHATDENGRPYVTGGKLTGAWANVGVVAAGMVTAGAASAAAKGAEATVGKEVARQFTGRNLREASANLTKLGDLRAELGAKGAAKWMRHVAAKELTSMGGPQRFLDTFGVIIAAEGPALATGDPLNVFGVKDIAKMDRVMALPRAALEDLEAELPDLHLDVPPAIGPAHHPEIRPFEPPPEPVMGR